MTLGLSQSKTTFQCLKIKRTFLFTVGNIIIPLMWQIRKLWHHVAVFPSNKLTWCIVCTKYMFELNILSFSKSLISSFKKYLLITSFLPVLRGSITSAFCFLAHSSSFLFIFFSHYKIDWLSPAWLLVPHFHLISHFQDWVLFICLAITVRAGFFICHADPSLPTRSPSSIFHCIEHHGCNSLPPKAFHWEDQMLFLFLSSCSQSLFLASNLPSWVCLI